MSEKLFIQEVTGVRYYRPAPGLLVFMFCMFLVGLPAMGISETRQHGAHVHGIGSLNVVLDGSVLMLELNSPAANIVGFEHAPHNEQQTQALRDASQILEDGEKLFVLSKKAECRIDETQVDNDIVKGHHEDHASDHDHKEHQEHKEHTETHGEKEHDHGGEHSEFTATYRFQCVYPDRLKSIEVMLFSLFPGFEEVHVQLLTPGQQTAVELTPKQSLIEF